MRQISGVFLCILFILTSYPSSYLFPIRGFSCLNKEPYQVAVLDNGENDGPEHIMPSIRSPPDMEYVENETGNALTWNIENGSSQKYEVWRSAHGDLNLNRERIQSGYLINGTMTITISVDGLTAGVYDFSLYVYLEYYTGVWVDTVTVTVLNHYIPLAPIDKITLVVLIGISSLIITC